MNFRDRTRIAHIIDAIKSIQAFTAGMSESDFIANDLVSSAVVRKFEIIGEAIRHLSDEYKQNNPEVPWQNANAMRNILIHEYFKVDLSILWKTIQESLPPLLATLEGTSEAA